MSEFMPTKERNEHLALPEHHELLLPDAEHAEPLRAGEADPVKALAEARTAVAETTATGDSSEAIQANLSAAESAPQNVPQMISKDLKDVTLRRELKSLQRREPLVRRSLSKVVHQPVVRAASQAASSSVSRPSGILGGGVIAFLGTTSYLLLAKHYGFAYNSGVFLALFAAGFALGLMLEVFVRLAGSSHRKAVDL